MLIGVVGKPSVGKSTFFKAATLAEVEIANYPFTTIKPNSAVGYVKVPDVAIPFGKRSNPREGFCVGDFRFVPVEVMDVAGLVPGAHEGKGMGNQFLDDLRQANALIHVIDVAGATNEKGESVPAGSYDPANDIKFLGIELDMWYLSILKKGWEKLARTIQQEKQEPQKVLAKQLSGLGVDEDMVTKALTKLQLSSTPVSWTEENLKGLATELRKSTKPMVIAANKIDMPTGKENYERLKTEFPDEIIIPCSAESELALREAAKHELIHYIPGEDDFELKAEDKLNDKQKAALQFIKDNILKIHNTTGVQQTIDKAVFELLKYIAIFPGGASKLEDQHGNTLPDCFLMKDGTTALDFAFRLHTDFGKNFIRAIDVKTKRTVGKDHVLKHTDIVEIIS